MESDVLLVCFFFSFLSSHFIPFQLIELNSVYCFHSDHRLCSCVFVCISQATFFFSFFISFVSDILTLLAAYAYVKEKNEAQSSEKKLRELRIDLSRLET